MTSVFTQAQLQELRVGDRVTFDGLQWEVRDYSTYADENGYETAEWLLHTPEKGDRYLLREVDPVNSEELIHWYISKEIDAHQVSAEYVSDNLQFSLWRAMREGADPYPTLQVMDKIHQFESKTTGDYNGSEGTVSRTTWDYWDDSHTWNLAIEAWPDGELHIYTTRIVNPSDFSDMEKGVIPLASTRANGTDGRTWQWLAAWSLTIGGVLLMIFGGR